MPIAKMGTALVDLRTSVDPHADGHGEQRHVVARGPTLRALGTQIVATVAPPTKTCDGAAHVCVRHVVARDAIERAPREENCRERHQAGEAG
ncbi:MAG: hypothetical protein JWP87_5717 [Labilithrix sp.]|nr:hypothetical protein [Labilithrix sp.]